MPALPPAIHNTAVFALLTELNIRHRVQRSQDRLAAFLKPNGARRRGSRYRLSSLWQAAMQVALRVAARAEGDRPSRDIGGCWPAEGSSHLARLASRLSGASSQRHAWYVRHATQEDLDQVEALLVELRKLPQLRERKRGYFSRDSRAFLHFHEDAGALYVDVRLDSAFRRARVTSGTEQADLLARVRRALQSTS